MKQRKIPMRMCAITRERFPKQELIRIVRTPENEIKIDLTGKINGHGAYIKKDVSIIEKARKSKVLNKMLETNIEDQIYDDLINMINK